MHSDHNANLEYFAAASTPYTLQLGVPVASYNHTILIFPYTPLLLLLLLCLLQLLRLSLLLLLLRWLVLRFLVQYRLLGGCSLPRLLGRAVMLLLLLWGIRLGLGQGG